MSERLISNATFRAHVERRAGLRVLFPKMADAEGGSVKDEELTLEIKKMFLFVEHLMNFSDATTDYHSYLSDGCASGKITITAHDPITARGLTQRLDAIANLMKGGK